MEPSTEGTCFFNLQCIVCLRSRAIMQVSPCGHQSLCRLCFVHNIKEAVANRDLPLRCIICNAKIARVKNNRTGNGSGPEHPVHVKGQTTNILMKTQNRSAPLRKMPTSVSGYSLCATSDDYDDCSNGDKLNNNRNGLPPSASNYSVSSGN